MNSLKKTLSQSLMALVIILFASWQATNADELRTTDYFVTHQSLEPFYKGNGLNDKVTLHVREVVKPGREREVANDGKVLLLLHGATFPGYVAFDLDHKNVSLMRHFASLGWDTFALDLEGYGMSTRPPIMDEPEKYPDRDAPISLDVTLADVGRVVDFIRDLRGTDKVHVLGWSAGAMAEGPRFAAKHPEKVAKLVLYASKYLNKKNPEELAKQDVKRNAEKNRMGDPSDIKRWAKLGTQAENLIEGSFDAYTKAHQASDPKSAELGGKIRAPWGRFIGWGQPQFDAASIKVPTLVIYGELDKIATREDNEALFSDLGSEVKQLVEIKGAGHMIHFEKSNEQFYKALQEFLDAKG